ncbi:MAG TPA: hypothetical protein VIU63_04100 [Nitrospira sp.]
MNLIRLMALIAFATAGCSLFIPSECRYLKTAQDKAAEQEVRTHLGTPVMMNTLSGGGSFWLYEVREEQPTHRGTPTGFWCDEYRLTFDSGGILRDWKHRSFFHGGELRPEPCRLGYERLAL